MVKLKYKKGARKEYKIKKQLEGEGWFVVRSAGSKGAADLVAFNKETHEIKLIQVKTYKLSPKQRKEALDPLEALETYYTLKAELL